MSRIDDAFDQERLDFGLTQKPNWNGTVYGSCQTKGCGNERRVAFYEGGFCKLCSIRHQEDRKKFALASHLGADGYYTSIPNPEIRWVMKVFVKDLSNKLSGSERQDFYMTPEQRLRRTDRTDYTEVFDPDEDIVEPKAVKTPKKPSEDSWYE